MLLSREQKTDLANCLNNDFSQLIKYDKSGKVDADFHHEEVEDLAINMILLAQSFQRSTDSRLKEKFISQVTIEDQSKDADAWTGEYTVEQQKKINEYIRSGLLTFKQMQQQLEKEMIADHFLQYMIEPILICEERFKFFTKRRNLTRM